jgi:hypothetical protein
MAKLSFRDLPFVVRLTSAMTPFMAWIMIEEFVIDRYGLNRFLPFYRVANPCVYDATVFTMIMAIWLWSERDRGAGHQA